MTSNGSAIGADKSADGANGDASREPPSKRRRVALACNACRTRKSRCNGERPKCSLCQNLGFDCQYEPTEASTNVIVKKEYVSDFESRLKNVEDMLRRHDDLLVGHLASCSGKADVHATSPHSSRHAHPFNAMTSRESIQLDASELQDIPAEETVTDGMAMSFVDEFDSVFFGPSSNIAFTKHILRAMASRNITQPKNFKSKNHRSLLDGGIVDYSRPASPNTPDAPFQSTPAIFELPAVAELEELFRVYFRNTGILFPFVHEPSFMETYYAFKASNFTKVRRTWLGLLNVILAMASSIDPSSKMNAVTRAERSNAFYERAVTLCGKSSIKGASLEIVQYLLLASQYLQGTQKSSQTWTLHGLAVKGALALGLHSNQASQRFSSLENEVRKRTWFGCVLLDRVLSMTFGRPPTIPEEYVRLPPPVPWPSSSKAEFAIPELQTPSMLFFSNSITLHGLIGMSISRLYGQNLGDDVILSEAELIPRIFELEQELSRWQSSLPAELSMVVSTALPIPASFRDRTVDRFRTMLTLRYHNLNILVHRPLLCKSLDFLAESIPEVWSNSVSRMTKDSVDACLGSAEETINIVHGILTDPSLGSSVLGAWWFTLYYLFNGSLVVFANSLIQRSTQPGLLANRPATDIEHLNRAIDAFRLLDSENRIVDRCREYVEYLLKVLERWSQNGKANGGRGMYVQRDLGVEQSGVPLQPSVGLGDLSATGGLPDLHDFLKDDLELAQFFASGIFDDQTPGNTMI